MAEHWLMILIEIIFVVNSFAAILTVFRDRYRDITSIWAWMLVLLLFPGIGFLIYFLFGRKLSGHHIFNMQTQEVLGIDKIADNQQKEVMALSDSERYVEEQAFIRLFLQNEQAIFSNQNEVNILTDGHEKFKQLFIDIKAAKHHINVEYYTIYNDKLGNEFVDLLTEKAKEGVRVRVIYDSWGSGGKNNKLYKRLREAGGHVEAFLMPKWQIMSLHVNNHDHRKLVIIDGDIGYIGGFNIGDQYLGRLEKFGYWRDTHLRVVGDAVLAMQSRFFIDWNATNKYQKLKFGEEYFPSHDTGGDVAMQIVSSGPDSESNQIYQGYLRMISMAHESITIQSPYFIPNQAIMDSLAIAAKSGVHVRIMIPSKPDHMFVYRATEYYASVLANDGIEVYAYNKGFLHAKTIVIDNRIVSVGSANMDIRSFSLNFEVNAFLYSERLALEMEAIFEKDLLDSQLLASEYFAEQSSWKRFKQFFSRLLTPIL
jgi:cardiolipin synthase